MALKSRSLFVYGLQVTEYNRSIDFKISGGGIEKQATLRLGFYSINSLCTEIARAMFEADATNIYTATVDRSIAGGLQNRITISTSGIFLSLLFATGSRNATTIAPLIGFNGPDKTGATTYQGDYSVGVPLVPERVGYNYLGPEFQKKVFGTTNVSASGLKEAVVFQIQRFIEVEFKYEPLTKVKAEWEPFFNWAIQQRRFEFTPEISSPNVAYDVTIEKTSSDGKGLGYRLREMLPIADDFTTGPIQMRVNES